MILDAGSLLLVYGNTFREGWNGMSEPEIERAWVASSDSPTPIYNHTIIEENF